MNQEGRIDKYLPIILALTNALLSSLSAHNTLPVKVIAGFEAESLIVALLAAISGTVLGLIKFHPSKLAVILLVVSVIEVLAIVQYAKILSQGGATNLELLLALLLYFYIFLVIFFSITHLELLLAKLIPKRNLDQ